MQTTSVSAIPSPPNEVELFHSMIGESIAHYRITAKLGEGGMGAVYRATDTKLNREVALKFLPPTLANDPDYMARFQREAQVLASLNHSNIAAIYGIEQNAIVMELVEGENLKCPTDQALPIARQLIEALEYAHDKGVIHRDLKPANIKITPEGTVKLLDFGLARVAQAFEPVKDDATLTMRTRMGVIMGTPAYMSPEQARAETADRRADIWSFGAVFFEMLSGKMAFQGDNVTDILASVVKLEPDWPALPASTPANIRRLIERCLKKDRRQRLQAIGEARIAIEEPASEAAPSIAPRQSRLPWTAAAILGLALAALALLHFREAPPELRVVKFTIPPPEKTAFAQIVVSPDGQRIAFTTSGAGKDQIWVRPLGALDAQPLAGTEGATHPFWSPDSRYIAFFAQGKLKKIEASGGPPLTLCDATGGRTGTWNRDDVILFSPTTSSGLFRVASGGGEAKPVTTPNAAATERSHRWPSFLPDGRRFLYTVQSSADRDAQGGVYIGSLDSKDGTRLLADFSNAVYVSSPSGKGYLLFWRGGTLMAHPFDPGPAKLSGEPFPVAEHVGHFALSGLAAFSVSSNGVLVYDTSAQLNDDQLTWFDRAGKGLGIVGEPDFHLTPWLSPDEKQVVVDRPDLAKASPDLWLIDLARGISTRFTFDPNHEWYPVWSPDGRRIVFSSNRERIDNLYQKLASGAGKDELLLKTPNIKHATSWSLDGRFLMYEELDQKTKRDLWVLPMTGDPKPIPFLRTEFMEMNGAISPDGKWIAYDSDESGRPEIYIQPFPASGAKWQVSKNGGRMPKWRRDGKELFYLGSDRKMMAVEVKSAATIQSGIPQPLFDSRVTGNQIHYAVTKDGQRFLIPTPLGESTTPPATVVLNFLK